MRHEVIEIPNGWGGTRATVANASRLVEASLRDPVVVTTAQDIVRHLPERDKWAEVQAVSNFVKRNVRYTNEGIETIKTPRLMLDEIRHKGRAVGDCDDHVILWAALHKALGNPVRFRVISQRADGLANHIYGEVYVPGRGWVSDELIVKHRHLGWHIPTGEVTKSVAFMAGLGGIGGRNMIGATRRRRVLTRQDLFNPGGGLAIHADRLRPRRSMYAVDPFVAQGFAIKSGGMMQRKANGRNGQIGFLGPLIAAAPALIEAGKKVHSMVKKPKKPAAAPQEAAAPAPGGGGGEGGMMKMLPWLALGFGALLVVPKLIGGRR